MLDLKDAVDFPVEEDAAVNRAWSHRSTVCSDGDPTRLSEGAVSAGTVPSDAAGIAYHWD